MILNHVFFFKLSVCRDGLGMESGAITDGQISASSEWDANHSAAQGRLHLQPSNNLQGCWSAALNDGNQWLKVDLGTFYTAVTRVATQGRNGTSYRQWVTKYKLQYSDDGENFKYYTEEGQNIHKVRHIIAVFNLKSKEMRDCIDFSLCNHSQPIAICA